MYLMVFRQTSDLTSRSGISLSASMNASYSDSPRLVRASLSSSSFKLRFFSLASSIGASPLWRGVVGLVVPVVLERLATLEDDLQRLLVAKVENLPNLVFERCNALERVDRLRFRQWLAEQYVCHASLPSPVVDSLGSPVSLGCCPVLLDDLDDLLNDRLSAAESLFVSVHRWIDDRAGEVALRDGSALHNLDRLVTHEGIGSGLRHG